MTDRSIVGVWQLVRYTTAYEGEPERYPLGRDAVGYIMYTADGFMSGSMMRAGREPFAVADRFSATTAEKARAFDDYVTYCGRYRVEDDRVLHSIEVSLLPNWIGEEQPRRIEWHGEARVSLVGEWVVEGRKRVATIGWTRA
jgi:hypothetical protein